MKTYTIVENDPAGERRWQWTAAELIAELSQVLEDEDESELDEEDMYARRFDQAVLEALRDFHALSEKLLNAGLAQMVEEIRVEKNIPAPPDEQEVVKLRILLARIARRASWLDVPGSPEHSVNRYLTIGRVEQFGRSFPDYGTTLMGERTGAMAHPSLAEAAVLGEAVSGTMSDAEDARRYRQELADAGLLGVELVANVQRHGPGSIFDSLKALGVSYVSASPMKAAADADWEIRGAQNVPDELPEWLSRKEGA